MHTKEKTLVDRIIHTLTKEGYKAFTHTSEGESEQSFYLVAVNDKDQQMELHVQPSSGGGFELWVLDDYGADQENPGDWIYLSTFMLRDDVYRLLKKKIPTGYPFIMKPGMVMMNPALEQALLEMGYEQEDINHIQLVQEEVDGVVHSWMDFRE